MAKVAWIGLGVMGYPMAGHIRKKGGHDLVRRRVALVLGEDPLDRHDLEAALQGAGRLVVAALHGAMWRGERRLGPTEQRADGEREWNRPLHRRAEV